MRISSNRVEDIHRFFRQELQGLYDSSEIVALCRTCLSDLAGLPWSDTLDPDRRIHEALLVKMSQAAKRLRNNEPVQYITGQTQFLDRAFLVNSATLIPRPETEELVQQVIRDAGGRSALKICDVGTGSGCIAISLALGLNAERVTATDRSSAALSVAAENAKRYNAKVEFRNEDIFESALPDGTNVVVSNPPYIAREEAADMRPNVLEFEPADALFAPGGDPLVFYRVIAEKAYATMPAGGLLFFEINPRYAGETVTIVDSCGFSEVTLITDLSNKNRILRGVKSS